MWELRCLLRLHIRGVNKKWVLIVGNFKKQGLNLPARAN